MVVASSCLLQPTLPGFRKGVKAATAGELAAFAVPGVTGRGNMVPPCTPPASMWDAVPALGASSMPGWYPCVREGQVQR
jgi:hypothetical protein